MAVRGRLPHADQGKELLTTSNVPAVCLLSADCDTQKENALDTRLLMRAQNGCLAKKQIHDGASWPTGAHRCLLFSCMHEWAHPQANTYALTRTRSPRDEECLIKTPHSSKPVTFHCRMEMDKKNYFSWQMQQICDELWELEPIWSHAPLWHLWGSAHHTFQQSLTTCDEASPLLVLLSTHAKYELFKAEHWRLLGPRGRRHASFSSD